MASQNKPGRCTSELQKKIIEAMKGSEGKPYAKLKSFQYGKIAAMLHINEELKFIDCYRPARLRQNRPARMRQI